MTILSGDEVVNFITFTPICFGLASILGSILIMTSLVRTWLMGRDTINHRRRRQQRRGQSASAITTYHRLMCGISVFDLLFSLAWVLGPAALPSDWFWPRASGTMRSCSFQGFLLTLGMGSYTYSTFLILYYLLLIRFTWSERAIARKVEPFLHGLGIAYHVGLAVTGFVLQTYQPSRSTMSFCWMGGSRGADIMFDWLMSFLMLLEMFLILIFLTLIAHFVWIHYNKFQGATVRDSQQRPAHEEGYQRSSDSPSAPLDLSSDLDEFGGSNHDNSWSFRPSLIRRRRRSPNNFHQQVGSHQARSRQVIAQCFRYGLNAVVMVTWSMLGRLFRFWGDDRFYSRNFWAVCCSLVFLPSQGLWNFAIYIRPRYVSIRSALPEISVYRALLEAIWFPLATSSERRSRCSFSNAAVRDGGWSGGVVVYDRGGASSSNSASRGTGGRRESSSRERIQSSRATILSGDSGGPQQTYTGPDVVIDDYGEEEIVFVSSLGEITDEEGSSESSQSEHPRMQRHDDTNHGISGVPSRGHDDSDPDSTQQQNTTITNCDSPIGESQVEEVEERPAVFSEETDTTNLTTESPADCSNSGQDDEENASPSSSLTESDRTRGNTTFIQGPELDT